MADDDKPDDKPDDDKDDKPVADSGKLATAKWKLFAIVAVLSLVVDQATKIWARSALETRRLAPPLDVACAIPDDIIKGACSGIADPVISSFWHWKLSMNLGSAFGLFSSQGSAGRIFLSIVGIVAVGGMFWMLRKARPDQKILHWALALVTGGAIGNLIDRIYYGAVTDFILWHVGDYNPRTDRWKHEWPVFNIADIVLVVGVGLMFIDIQKEGKRDKARKKARQERAKKQGLVKDLRVD